MKPLRASVPELFARLPWTFVSEDYFGTYDEYAFKSCANQTLMKMAVPMFRRRSIPSLICV